MTADRAVTIARPTDGRRRTAALRARRVTVIGQSVTVLLSIGPVASARKEQTARPDSTGVTGPMAPAQLKVDSPARRIGLTGSAMIEILGGLPADRLRRRERAILSTAGQLDQMIARALIVLHIPKVSGPGLSVRQEITIARLTGVLPATGIVRLRPMVARRVTGIVRLRPMVARRP